MKAYRFNRAKYIENMSQITPGDYEDRGWPKEVDGIISNVPDQYDDSYYLFFTGFTVYKAHIDWCDEVLV